MKCLKTPPEDALKWFRYAEEHQQRQLQQCARLSLWANHIAQLVHALQRERGTSNIWLCSRGELFLAELSTCTRQVDQQIDAFKQLLIPADALNATQCTGIASTLWRLAELPAWRRSIIEGTAEPEQVMNGFNQTIRYLLNIIPDMVDTIDSPSVARAMTALYSFMQGKEFVGQERALGAIGFTRSEFDTRLRQQLVDIIDSQQHCFETFFSLDGDALAPPDSNIEQLRRQACTRLPPEQEKHHLVLHWFALQTARIEALHEQEALLITRLETALREHLSHPPGQQETIDNDAQADWRLNRHLLPLVRQQARQLTELTNKLASLQAMLEERKLIDKAKGLLIQYQYLSEEQAWQHMRKMAMDQNRRMADIAAAIISVSDLWRILPKE